MSNEVIPAFRIPRPATGPSFTLPAIIADQGKKASKRFFTFLSE